MQTCRAKSVPVWCELDRQKHHEWCVAFRERWDYFQHAISLLHEYRLHWKIACKTILRTGNPNG
jgi:hypothetical protein